jgi:hypothetical protein
MTDRSGENSKGERQREQQQVTYRIDDDRNRGTDQKRKNREQKDGIG